MKTPRAQLSLRLSPDADPRYCAKALCRAKRTKRATHIVTIAGQEFRTCGACARPYEGMDGVTVVEIKQEVA